MDIQLAPGINLLSGRNGQGKSNVLEAICYLGLLRSFRTHSVSDLLHWDRQTFALKGIVRDKDAAFSFELAVTQGRKRLLRLNGDAVGRASDFINRFICVPLVPEDIELIKGPAAERRRFLDIALSQHDPAYMSELNRYREAVRSRNALLRGRESGRERMLRVYDNLIVEHGSRVEASRRYYVTTFTRTLQELSAKLLGTESAVFGVTYRCAGISREVDTDGVESLAAVLERALQSARERDLREGHTTVGPHRAELVITLGGRRLADFGSEGECRLGSLAMRLTSLKEISRESAQGRSVVVLVDDVIGELDGERRRLFFEVLEQADQVIMTATEVPRALHTTPSTHYRVKSGILECV